MHSKQRILTLLLFLLALCVWVSPWWTSPAQGETRIGTYIDCLWEGSQKIREEDFDKLRDAGFDLFFTPLGPDALDPKTPDGRFLEACKATKAQVGVVRNALSLEQLKLLTQKYPGVIAHADIFDDAHQLKPAELTRLIAETTPFLGGAKPYLAVGRGTAHADYAGLLPPGGLYGIQNYLGKDRTAGGLRECGYDRMLPARAACKGRLATMPFLARNNTPAGEVFRRDPVWLAHEYIPVAQNEALVWLGLIAGCDDVLYYTAYFIERNQPTDNRYYTRIAERWDLLPAYKRSHARIKELDKFLSGPGVVKTRSVQGNFITGTWTLPSGEKLTVTVDLTSEWLPDVDWDVTAPLPTPTAKVSVSREGVRITAPAGVEFATAP